MHVAHQTSLGVGVVLFLVLLGGAIYVGYHFHYRSAKPFKFHYFKVTSCFITSTAALAYQRVFFLFFFVVAALSVSLNFDSDALNLRH